MYYSTTVITTINKTESCVNEASQEVLHDMLWNRLATLQAHVRFLCTSKQSIGIWLCAGGEQHGHSHWPEPQVRPPQLGFTQTIGIVTALLVLARVGLPSSQAVTLPSPYLVRSCLFNAPFVPWSPYKTPRAKYETVLVLIGNPHRKAVAVDYKLFV